MDIAPTTDIAECYLVWFLSPVYHVILFSRGENTWDMTNLSRDTFQRNDWLIFLKIMSIENIAHV